MSSYVRPDGGNDIKRLSLRLRTHNKDVWYNFMINPEEYEETHPQRTNVYRTKDTIVIEDYGQDLGRIKFSGTTGYRQITEQNSKGSLIRRNGAQRLHALESMLSEYAKSGDHVNPGSNPNKAQLILYNRTDGKSWYVHLDEDGLSIQRSAEESLLYRYTVNLVILRKADKPSIGQINAVSLGNPITKKQYWASNEYRDRVERNPYASNNRYQRYIEGLQTTARNYQKTRNPYTVDSQYSSYIKELQDTAGAYQKARNPYSSDSQYAGYIKELKSIAGTVLEEQKRERDDLWRGRMDKYGYNY